MRTTTFLLAVAALVAAAHDRASAQTASYFEGFDSVNPPKMPNGWSSPDSTWETSTGVTSPGSGLNNVINAGNRPGSIVSPLFDFTAITSATVTYLARRTATYDSLNLQLEASIDGGATWEIVLGDSTAALPGNPSVYTEMRLSLPETVVGQPLVRMRFLARHSTGGNVRIDDFAIAADGPVGLNRFGFSRTAWTVPEEQDSLTAFISLNLIAASPNLQGIQFSLETSNGLRLQGVGLQDAALAGVDWHFSTQGSDSLSVVVLISEGTAGLAPPGADSLFYVTFSTNQLDAMPTRRDSIWLKHVVASSASPGGEDLDLTVDPPVLVMEVTPLSPHFAVSPDTLDVGMLDPDSTWSGTMLLSNEGTSVLDVVDMYSISGLVGISPAFVTIPVDSFAAIDVSITAGDYGFGPFEDWIVIEHSGLSSPDTVAVVGSVVSTSTRGDVNDDQVVDILDLVLGVDLILGRIEIPGALQRVDLNPFPAGNGTVDVRDLTVLAQAIARGVWPDQTALATSFTTGKTSAPGGDLVLNETEHGLELWVRSSISLRAIHVIGRLSEGDLATQIESKAASAQFAVPYNPLGNGSFSIVLFGMGSPPFRKGEPVLVAEIASATASDVDLISMTAVDEQRGRRSLVAVHESSLDRPDPGLMVMHPPYPNPIDPSASGIVHIPLDIDNRDNIRWTVADVLGRLVRTWSTSVEAGHRVVSWDLQQRTGIRVVPGLYFITAGTDTWRQTRALMVQ